MKYVTKTHYDRTAFYCRWIDKPWGRPEDWVLIGISIRWVFWNSYCYKISFFGFEVSIWLKRTETKVEEAQGNG